MFIYIKQKYAITLYRSLQSLLINLMCPYIYKKRKTRKKSYWLETLTCRHVRISLPAPNRHGTMSNMQPGFRDKSFYCQMPDWTGHGGPWSLQTSDRRMCAPFPFGDLEGAHVCPSKRQCVSKKQFGRSVTEALALSV